MKFFNSQYALVTLLRFEGFLIFNMITLIKWGGLNRDGYWSFTKEDNFRCGEFIINHEVVNHLKIGECIWLDSFVDFIEIIDENQYHPTQSNLENLKNAIRNIGNGASKVEDIVYSFDESIFYKIIHLSED